MKARLLLPTLAVLLLVVPLATVCASTSLTIPYTDFNAGIVEHPTGYASDVWSVRIINSLNFTGTSSIAKIFIANSTGADFFAINVNLAPELNDSTRYSADFYIATKVDPEAGNWTHLGMINNLKYGKAYYIRLDSVAQLTVTDGIKVLLSNPATSFPAVNIRTDGANATTSGYVQVTTSNFTATPTETVYTWIPLVIVFAMLGLALDLLRRMAK